MRGATPRHASHGGLETEKGATTSPLRPGARLVRSLTRSTERGRLFSLIHGVWHSVLVAATSVGRPSLNTRCCVSVRHSSFLVRSVHPTSRWPSARCSANPPSATSSNPPTTFRRRRFVALRVVSLLARPSSHS